MIIKVITTVHDFDTSDEAKEISTSIPWPEELRLPICGDNLEIGKGKLFVVIGVTFHTKHHPSMYNAMLAAEAAAKSGDPIATIEVKLNPPNFDKSAKLFHNGFSHTP